MIGKVTHPFHLVAPCCGEKQTELTADKANTWFPFLLNQKYRLQSLQALIFFHSWKRFKCVEIFHSSHPWRDICFPNIKFRIRDAFFSFETVQINRFCLKTVPKADLKQWFCSNQTMSRNYTNVQARSLESISFFSVPISWRPGQDAAQRAPSFRRLPLQRWLEAGHPRRAEPQGPAVLRPRHAVRPPVRRRGVPSSRLLWPPLTRRLVYFAKAQCGAVEWNRGRQGRGTGGSRARETAQDAVCDRSPGKARRGAGTWAMPRRPRVDQGAVCGRVLDVAGLVQLRDWRRIRGRRKKVRRLPCCQSTTNAIGIIMDTDSNPNF